MYVLKMEYIGGTAIVELTEYGTFDNLDEAKETLREVVKESDCRGINLFVYEK